MLKGIGVLQEIFATCIFVFALVPLTFFLRKTKLKNNTVRVFSDEFGLSKCAALIMKRGKY